MRKLALEEQDKDTGDAFRPREEPPDPEIDETLDVEDVVVAEEAGEDTVQSDQNDDDDIEGDKS